MRLAVIACLLLATPFAQGLSLRQSLEPSSSKSFGFQHTGSSSDKGPTGVIIDAFVAGPQYLKTREISLKSGQTIKYFENLEFASDSNPGFTSSFDIGNQNNNENFQQSDFDVDITVAEVIDNLLCHASKAVTGQGDQNRDAYSWCSSYTYSTTATLSWSLAGNVGASSSQNSPAANFDPTSAKDWNVDTFQVEDYDILDQQCFTRSNSEKDEFDDIICKESSHFRDDNAAETRWIEDAGLSNPHDGLDRSSTGGAEADGKVSTDLFRDAGSGRFSFRLAADSRYPDQEYCIEDETLLTQLFGCADDQRIQCGSATKCTSANLDECQCAGSISSDTLKDHSNYLEWNPFDSDARNNQHYGDDVDNNYVCSVPEITVANALSAYLDKADKDVRLACEMAADRFHEASQAYVDFINPNKHATGNLYGVLHEAWRQAEFTLRSAKIQEQTLIQMEMFEKTMIDRFNGDQQTIGQEPTDTVKDFINDWSEIRNDYKAVSGTETTALVDDLQTMVNQIELAKDFAEKLSAAQISASSALATVSVHFRKKLQLWMRLETMLENQFASAFDTTAANGLNDEHLVSNMAITAQHENPTNTWSSSKAEIQAGSTYHRDRENHDQDPSFTSTTPTATTTIEFSNDAITTNKNCDGEMKTTVGTDYPAGFTYPKDCEDYLFLDADHPTHNRVPTCDGGFCTLPKSEEWGVDTHVKHEITTSVIASAGDKSYDAPAAVSEGSNVHNDKGQYSGETVTTPDNEDRYVNTVSRSDCTDGECTIQESVTVDSNGEADSGTTEHVDANLDTSAADGKHQNFLRSNIGCSGYYRSASAVEGGAAEAFLSANDNTADYAFYEARNHICRKAEEAGAADFSSCIEHDRLPLDDGSLGGCTLRAKCTVAINNRDLDTYYLKTPQQNQFWDKPVELYADGAVPSHEELTRCGYVIRQKCDEGLVAVTDANGDNELVSIFFDESDTAKQDSANGHPDDEDFDARFKEIAEKILLRDNRCVTDECQVNDNDKALCLQAASGQTSPCSDSKCTIAIDEDNNEYYRLKLGFSDSTQCSSGLTGEAHRQACIVQCCEPKQRVVDFVNSRNSNVCNGMTHAQCKSAVNGNAELDLILTDEVFCDNNDCSDEIADAGSTDVLIYKHRTDSVGYISALHYITAAPPTYCTIDKNSVTLCFNAYYAVRAICANDFECQNEDNHLYTTVGDVKCLGASNTCGRDANGDAAACCNKEARGKCSALTLDTTTFDYSHLHAGSYKTGEVVGCLGDCGRCESATCQESECFDNVNKEGTQYIDDNGDVQQRATCDQINVENAAWVSQTGENFQCTPVSQGGGGDQTRTFISAALCPTDAASCTSVENTCCVALQADEIVCSHTLCDSGTGTCNAGECDQRLYECKATVANGEDCKVAYRDCVDTEEQSDCPADSNTISYALKDPLETITYDNNGNCCEGVDRLSCMNTESPFRQLDSNVFGCNDQGEDFKHVDKLGTNPTPDQTCAALGCADSNGDALPASQTSCCGVNTAPVITANNEPTAEVSKDGSSFTLSFNDGDGDDSVSLVKVVSVSSRIQVQVVSFGGAAYNQALTAYNANEAEIKAKEVEHQQAIAVAQDAQDAQAIADAEQAIVELEIELTQLQTEADKLHAKLVEAQASADEDQMIYDDNDADSFTDDASLVKKVQANLAVGNEVQDASVTISIPARAADSRDDFHQRKIIVQIVVEDTQGKRSVAYSTTIEQAGNTLPDCPNAHSLSGDAADGNSLYIKNPDLVDANGDFPAETKPLNSLYWEVATAIDEDTSAPKSCYVKRARCSTFYTNTNKCADAATVDYSYMVLLNDDADDYCVSNDCVASADDRAVCCEEKKLSTTCAVSGWANEGTCNDSGNDDGLQGQIRTKTHTISGFDNDVTATGDHQFTRWTGVTETILIANDGNIVEGTLQASYGGGVCDTLTQEINCDVDCVVDTITPDHCNYATGDNVVEGDPTTGCNIASSLLDYQADTNIVVQRQHNNGQSCADAADQLPNDDTYQCLGCYEGVLGATTISVITKANQDQCAGNNCGDSQTQWREGDVISIGVNKLSDDDYADLPSDIIVRLKDGSNNEIVEIEDNGDSDSNDAPGIVQFTLPADDWGYDSPTAITKLEVEYGTIEGNDEIAEEDIAFTISDAPVAQSVSAWPAFSDCTADEVTRTRTQTPAQNGGASPITVFSQSIACGDCASTDEGAGRCEGKANTFDVPLSTCPTGTAQNICDVLSAENFGLGIQLPAGSTKTDVTIAASLPPSDLVIVIRSGSTPVAHANVQAEVPVEIDSAHSYIQIANPDAGAIISLLEEHTDAVCSAQGVPCSGVCQLIDDDCPDETTGDTDAQTFTTTEIYSVLSNYGDCTYDKAGDRTTTNACQNTCDTHTCSDGKQKKSLQLLPTEDLNIEALDDGCCEACAANTFGTGGTCTAATQCPNDQFYTAGTTTADGRCADCPDNTLTPTAGDSYDTACTVCASGYQLTGTDNGHAECCLLKTWVVDADGDGYADGTDETPACEAPTDSILKSSAEKDNGALVIDQCPENADLNEPTACGTCHTAAPHIATCGQEGTCHSYSVSGETTTVTCHCGSGYGVIPATDSEGNALTGAGTCEVCTNDEYNNEVSGAACAPDQGTCPNADQFISGDGGSTGDNVCGDCSDNMLTSAADDTACTQCKAGYKKTDTDANGHAVCEPCDAGSYSLGGTATECTAQPQCTGDGEFLSTTSSTTQLVKCEVCDTINDCHYKDPTSGDYTVNNEAHCFGVPDTGECEACNTMTELKLQELVSGNYEELRRADPSTGQVTDDQLEVRIQIVGNDVFLVYKDVGVSIPYSPSQTSLYNWNAQTSNDLLYQFRVRLVSSGTATNIELKVDNNGNYFQNIPSTVWFLAATINADGTVTLEEILLDPKLRINPDIEVLTVIEQLDADGDKVCDADEASCLTSQYYDDDTNTCHACDVNAASSGGQDTDCECNSDTGYVQDPNVAVTAAATCVEVPECTPIQIYVEATNVCANCLLNQVANSDNQCVCAEGFVDPPNDDPNSGCEQVVPCTSSDEKYDSLTNECVACDPGYLSANTNVIGGTTDDTECDAGCDTEAGYQQTSEDPAPLECALATCQLCEL